MANRVCPFWVGYILISPLRKLLENPDKILGQFVKKGMTILEPGCGMGYFTIPLAKMVGPTGKIVAMDIQYKMLSALKRRAYKAGLLDRIELRHIKSDRFRIEDLSCKLDFVAALHMVHEISNQKTFFTEIWQALKFSGKVLVIEPKGHVTINEFAKTLAIAEDIGFKVDSELSDIKRRKALLHKP